MKTKITILLSGLMFYLAAVIQAQELGANFNHNPEIIDFEYLEKSKVNWVRTTPRIFDYLNDRLSIENDPGLQKVIEASQKGYQVAFGFRWDFNLNKVRVPEPGSAEEKALFETERKILEKVGPYVQIFKLGNEPNLETPKEDMYPDESSEIPLVRFMERQLEFVVKPYYEKHPELTMPEIYIGSFPRLFIKEEREIPAVVQLIKMANENPAVTGLAVHLHISNFAEVEDSFQYVRSLMPDKPIIIPEFSLHRLYRDKISEPLGATDEGKTFAHKYDRDPGMKLYEWCSIANSQGVSQEEWEALFYSRSWFPKNYLNLYKAAYQKYGVVLATFPLFQQYCPDVMTSNSMMWFINPIFCQKSLKPNTDGSYGENPLVFQDFIQWVEETSH